MSWVKSSSVVRALKQNLQEVEQQAHNLFELISRDPSLSESSFLPAVPLPPVPSSGVAPLSTNSGIATAPPGGLDSTYKGSSTIASNTAPFETSTTASIANAAASVLAANGTSLAGLAAAGGSASITTNLFISSAAAAAAAGATTTMTTTTTTATGSTTTTTTTTAGIVQPPLASSFLGLLRTHVTDSIHQANESIDCLAKMDEITEIHQPTIENVRKLVDTIHEQVSQLSQCYLMSKSPSSSMTFANGRIDMSAKGKDALSLYQMSTLQFAEESMNLLAAKIMDDDGSAGTGWSKHHQHGGAGAASTTTTTTEQRKPAWSLPDPPSSATKPKQQHSNGGSSTGGISSNGRKILTEQKKFVLALLKDGVVNQQMEAVLNVQAEVLQKVIDSSSPSSSSSSSSSRR
jgi:hypothetical protein